MQRLGSSNSNLFNHSSWVSIDGYNYFIAGDNGLYLYTSEEAPSDARLIASRASNVMLGDNSIYYAAPTGETDNFCKIDPDGENSRSVYSSNGATDYANLQYVKISGGAEYLYFLQTSAGEGTLYLYRCPLKPQELDYQGTPKRVLKEEVIWYNLYGDSLYYVDNTYQLMKADLNGRHSKVLDNTYKICLCLYDMSIFFLLIQ